MSTQKIKIFRYTDSHYKKMLEKESEIIAAMQTGTIKHCLHLYQCNSDTLVLPSGAKWRQTQEISQALKNIGWSLTQRRSGGAPVPQTPGLINLSHFYIWDDSSTYSVAKAYEYLSSVLQGFFQSYGIDTKVHSTPYSYCDGIYNININGKKIVGTAQRVMHKKGGGKIVLAQACIILNEDLTRVVEPVNLINKLHNIPDRVKADAHTSLAEHLTDVPNYNQVFTRLIESFLNGKEPVIG